MQFSSINVTLSIPASLAKCISFVRWQTTLRTTLASSFVLLLVPSSSLQFFLSTFWTVCSFLIADSHHWYFVRMLSLCSGVDKAKPQMLQMLLPSEVTLASVVTLRSGHLSTALDVWAKSSSYERRCFCFSRSKSSIVIKLNTENFWSTSYCVDQQKFHNSVLVLVVVPDKNIWLLFSHDHRDIFALVYVVSVVCCGRETRHLFIVRESS